MAAPSTMRAPPAATMPIPVPLAELFTVAGEHERSGRLDEAERLLSHILAAAPEQADALHLMGIVAYRKGRMEQALDRMERSIEHGVNTPLYWRNICEVYRVLGRDDDALAAGRRAVALNPVDPDSFANLGIIHAGRGEVEQTIACTHQALALDPMHPGAHFELAEALLLKGEFARGWEEYEWRFRIAGAAPLMPRTDRPQWDGQPLDGTLLLIADQGFGDAIQFCRYIPWAAERCPKIAVACSGETLPIMARQHPGLAAFTRWEQCPKFAAFCPLSGLPRLHGTRLDSIFAPIPYVQADPDRARRWAGRLDRLVPSGLLRVGIVWAGRPTHNNDRNRSASLAAFAPIAALEGIALVVLQKGPAQRQAGTYYGRAPLVNCGAEIADFEDTAAIVEGLDLVVTVDTSVAHLAGAMGKPVWIMLSFAPEWRWLLDRPDSPWYPTARLFRQTLPRRWDLVAAEIAEALKAQAEGTVGSQPSPRRRRKRAIR